MKSLASADLCAAVNDMLLVRFKTMYMNALKTCVTPLIFFSVTVCVAQFWSFSEAGRMGAQIIFSFLTKTLAAASIGAGIFFLFAPGGSIHMTADSAATAAMPQHVDYIVNVIPSNILLPFLNMDMIQLIVLSFVIGGSIGSLKESAKIILDFFDSSSKLFMAITKMLLVLLPVGAFCSVMSVILVSDTGILLSLAGFSASTIAGLIALMCFVCLYVALFGRLNPITYIKKYLPAMILSLPSSTAGCIPINLEYCEKLGIPKPIYSFSVPLGATVSLDGAAMYVVLSSLMLAKIYGVTLSANDVLTVIVSGAVIVISAPGIPGASLICISAVLSQINVPAEALGIVMSIDAVLNIIRTPVNIFSATSTPLVVSSRLGLLDRNIFDGR